MEKKKYIQTEEQKERSKATRALRKANRSPERIAEDKAKAKIAQDNLSPEKVAEYKAGKKKQTYTPEQNERRKIKRAEWRVKNPSYMAKYHQENKIKANKVSREWYKKNTEKANANQAKWKKENPEKIKANQAKFKKNNPDYISPCRIKNPEYQKEHNHKHDLGYYCVYLLENYNSLGDAYVGQTGNLYTRMQTHKSLGRLNTEAYRILQCFETREQAMVFEAIQHEAGYHGYNNGH